MSKIKCNRAFTVGTQQRWPVWVLNAEELHPSDSLQFSNQVQELLQNKKARILIQEGNAT